MLSLKWSQVHPQEVGYPLRPEVIESAYVLWSTTREPRYLRVAEGMLGVLRRFNRCDCGYCAVRNITSGARPAPPCQITGSRDSDQQDQSAVYRVCVNKRSCKPRQQQGIRSEAWDANLMSTQPNGSGVAQHTACRHSSQQPLSPSRPCSVLAVLPPPHACCAPCPSRQRCRCAGELDDSMESFFLAETSKYLYLLLSNATAVNDFFVFSTEGHLLPVLPSAAEAASTAPPQPQHQNPVGGDLRPPAGAGGRDSGGGGGRAEGACGDVCAETPLAELIGQVCISSPCSIRDYILDLATCASS